MSSSERLPRLELCDLARGAPPAPASNFQVRASFDGVGVRAARPPTLEEVRAAAFSEGERAGRSAAAKELAPARSALEELARALADARRACLEGAASELTHIAGEIARRVVFGELRQAEDVVLRMARACIGEVVDAGPCTLHVAPADLELVRTHLPELEAELADHALVVRADATLARGGVVLETPTGCFEGRPERVLAAALGEEAS